jgi:hypothetical protein
VNKKPHWTERLGNELPPWWEPEPEWMTPWVKKKLESGERPPWEAGNEREQQWMMAWVLQKLDEADLSERRRLDAVPVDKASLMERLAMDAFRRGNVGPLRRRHPEIAEAINLPTLENGRHWKKSKKFSRADAAAQDVRRIRAIWQQPEPAGYGKKNRKGHLQPTAEDIALERWEDVTAKQLRDALKKLKPL